MRVKDVFYIQNGIVSTGLKLYSRPASGLIPYLRPASTQRRTISGFVSEEAVGTKNVYPPETLFVSTNGEGSHSYSYVSSFKFSCNSDVSVLIPKNDMSIQEKIFYARCITMNRYKFSYGRKPKGKRLGDITLPASPPEWIYDINLSKLDGISQPKIRAPSSPLSTGEWKKFKIGDLFDIKKGKRLTKANMIKGHTPYVGASDGNNGITNWIGQDPIHDAGTISVSYNGSVAEAFYQASPFWATDDVNVLYPRGFSLNASVGLFFCTIIRMEKFRFSYGRKWHMDRMKESLIKLPVNPSGEPDYELMEDFMNNLNYSKIL